MSLGALALAVLLHVAAALALWWMTVNRPPVPPVEEAIEITIEKPKPPDPPPPPPPEPKPQPQPQAQPKPQPAPPLRGVPPPAEITADKRSQVPPSGDQPKDIAGPPPRSLDDPVPKPQPPTQAATAEPPKPKEPPPPVEQPVPQPQPPAPAVESSPPPPKEPPRLEQAVPPPSPPAPAVASLPPLPKEPSPPSVVPKPPPPAPAVTTVQPPPRPQSPPIVTPHPQPRPTPQIARPQGRPPAMANRDTPHSSSPFVNPADVRNRALASDNYIWQNARKLSFYIDEPVREYYITLRLVIARDGRLLAADVAQSSGTPSIDQAILAGARRNSPYLPLPAEIGGDRATFLVPLSTLRARF